MKKVIFSAIIFISTMACADLSDDAGFQVFSDASDFNVGLEGWTGDFADYPTGADDSTFYELQFEHTNRPANLGAPKKAILLSGNNHSDDLFMFIKKKINGLRPNTNYTVGFEVELASNAEKNSVGIGGSPGESVYLKVGGSGAEPKKIVEGSFYRLNIDKGNQSTGGSDMQVVGNIAVESSEYSLLTKSNSNAYDQFSIRSNSFGELWLIVGTDSGFEGTTTVYYTKINFVFSTSN